MSNTWSINGQFTISPISTDAEAYALKQSFDLWCASNGVDKTSSFSSAFSRYTGKD